MLERDYPFSKDCLLQLQWFTLDYPIRHTEGLREALYVFHQVRFTGKAHKSSDVVSSFILK